MSHPEIMDDVDAFTARLADFRAALAARPTIAAAAKIAEDISVFGVFSEATDQMEALAAYAAIAVFAEAVLRLAAEELDIPVPSIIHEVDMRRVVPLDAAA